MAINKNGTGYTFVFAVAMVVVVGAALAVTSISLKPRQQANAADKKMMDILGAINVKAERSNAKDKFAQYVTRRISINSKGEVVEEKDGEISTTDPDDPFNIDIKKDYRANKPSKGDLTWSNAGKLTFPVFECQKEGNTFYVVPMVGTGLWGPIWGDVALESDGKTIYGAKFDHKTETPGLGAEIKEDFFTEKFVGKTLAEAEKGGMFFEVKKGGSQTDEHSVDGITGGTITSKGVDEMINRTMGVYVKYFNNAKQIATR